MATRELKCYSHNISPQSSYHKEHNGKQQLIQYTVNINSFVRLIHVMDELNEIRPQNRAKLENVRRLSASIMSSSLHNYLPYSEVINGRVKTILPDDSMK